MTLQISVFVVGSKNSCCWCSFYYFVQETQLSLTNRRDAFIGHSRSPSIVPLHMLDIVSYCAIVTLPLRRYDIQLQKCHDLENRIRGHSR